MIYLELTQSMFTQAFHDHGRGDQFTHEALCAMYDYINSAGDLRLDVVGLCCDYTEYTLEEFENSEECKHLTQDDVAFPVKDHNGVLISYVVGG